MIGRRLFRWRCSVRLPWRLARRRAALLAGAPASQRMQAEQFKRICGRALPFALCVGRACGLCVLAWRFSALMAWVAACFRVLVPPGLRRRRPPRRRPAVRVRGRAAAGRRVEVWQLPRPLAVWPSSVWAAWPLAALPRAASLRASRRCLASSRRARGSPPGACAGGFAAFGFASARLVRPRVRARGVFLPPNNPPFFPVALARRDAENLS